MALPLYKFIEQKYNIYPSNELSDAFRGCSSLLSDLYVLPTHEPQIHVKHESTQYTFNELLDKCRLILMHENRSSNVLVHGYRIGGFTAADSTMINTSIQVNGVLLANSAWISLHKLLGDSYLQDLLLNNSGFLSQGKSFLHLFGPSIGKSFVHQFDKREWITLDKAFYKTKAALKHLDPIPMKNLDLVKQVFERDYKYHSNHSRVLKRHKQFLKLSACVVKNHERLKYFEILSTVCQEESNPTDYLGLCLGKSDVVRFCTVIFDKLFPKDIYGTSHNKSVIFKSLGRLISGQRGTKIGLDECVKGIKLKDIPWLGKSYAGNLNIQDFLKREGMFKAFLRWLLSVFFTKLLGSFFHLTHISSSKETLFFYHATWERISRPFIKSFTDKYLLECDLQNIGNPSSSSSVVISRLRVMPKKSNDFRVINTPLRGRTKAERFEYTKMVNSEIRPAKRILNQLRLLQDSFSPKVTSLSHVPTYIGNFKEKLLKKYGHIPELFFVKFDVKACYDNIPREKVYQLISDLTREQEVYYYCSRPETDLSSSTSCTSKHFHTSENLAQIFQMNPNRKPFVLNSSIISGESMHSSDISRIAKSQLQNSVTILGYRFYTRKRGVFQGLHHSGLFCDVVYDKLIEDKFHFLRETESLILRIADDFLIASTDHALTSRCKSLLMDGIEEYGIMINDLKTVVNFSSLGTYDDTVPFIDFCGFRINTVTLDVIKEFDRGLVPSMSLKSHRKVLQKLIGVYKLRISYNTLNMKVNSFDTILKQLSIIVRTIAESYCVFTKNIVLATTGFEEFIEEMQIESFKVLKSSEFLPAHRAQVKTALLSTFHKVLSQKNTKYRDLIGAVSYRINNC